VELHHPGKLFSSPAVANGVFYVGSGHYAKPGKVYALKASTGALLWSYTTGWSVEFSSPAVANGVVMSARRTATCTR
jgi:outer membrane protein assembly factor BamB